MTSRYKMITGYEGFTDEDLAIALEEIKFQIEAFSRQEQYCTGRARKAAKADREIAEEQLNLINMEIQARAK